MHQGGPGGAPVGQYAPGPHAHMGMTPFIPQFQPESIQVFKETLVYILKFP